MDTAAFTTLSEALMSAARQWGARDEPPARPSTHPALLPGLAEVGVAAIQSLSTELHIQLDWMRTHWNRRGHFTSKSVPFQQRLTAQRFEHHVPSVLNQTDGDHFGLLVRILLGKMHDGKFLERIEGSIPRLAIDPIKFHRSYYKRWTDANDRWRELDSSRLADALYEFLFMLWTTDKQGTELVPRDPKRRKLCNAGWKSFYISEAELKSLAMDVVTQYLRNVRQLK